jgi:hypothetical protein
MSKLPVAAVFAALMMCATSISAETLTNSSVVALSKAGLGSDAIIAKIHNSANTFDLSTDSLISLKQQGVADEVIASMLSASANRGTFRGAVSESESADPTAQHASGIYLLESWDTPPIMRRIDATAANQTRTSGILGYAFTYGIAKIKITTVLPNPTARVKSSIPRPAFYFYFDRSNTILTNGGLGDLQLPGTVTSPNEFSLVRFDTKRGDREVELGQMNITGMTAGVMDKARVNFSYSDISPGVFRVTPDGDLSPGEYGFVYSSTGGVYGGFSGARIFDFSIPRQ